MSADAAKRFLIELTEDVALRKRLVDAANGDERAAIAREAGFEFSREEFEAAVAEYEEVGKLSSEEAETIAFSAMSLLGAVQTGLRPPYGPADFYSTTRLDPQSFTIQLRRDGGQGGFAQQ
jgi:predicted ribosomally synthesized peptide with nif11-like leader